jgi:hypothetical protein
MVLAESRAMRDTHDAVFYEGDKNCAKCTADFTVIEKHEIDFQ